MATRWKHKRTATRNVDYEFTCEHCRKNSGLLTAKIIGEAEYETLYKNLNDKQKEKLQRDANTNLEKMFESAKHNSFKDVYHTAFKDKCPHCGKQQSWAVSGLKDWYIVGGLIGIIIGALFGFALFNGGTVDLVGWVLLTFGGLAIGLVIAFIRITIKKVMTRTDNHEKPTIFWPTDEEVIEIK